MRSMTARQVADMCSSAGVGHGTGPAYARLAASVRMLILDGRMPLDTRLPSERDLAAQLGLSRTTVTAAYDALRSAGYASSRKGSGTWTTLPDSVTADPEPPPWAATSPSDGIDLAHAAPEAPAQALRAAYDHALTVLPHYLPGHGYHLFGLDDLRAAIAHRFTSRGLATTPDQILVTAGAQHAFSLLVALLVDQGDRVLMEHPTYPNALDAVRRAGGRPVPVGFAGDEWDVGAVRAAIGQTSPRLAYIIPDFHNPTGLVASATQRRDLAAAFGRSRTTVVVDETLVELGFADPPPRFGTYGPGVITIGSASKTFWGGLRIGWIRADTTTIRRLAVIRANVDNASPVVEQLVAAHLIEHIDDVVPARRGVLRDRRDLLLRLLGDAIPDWTCRVPDGGLVLWCDLGAPLSSRLVTAAEPYGLRLGSGTRFGVDGAFERRLRLPYTHPPEVLERSVELLASAYRAAIARPAGERAPDVFA
jgi:DNA-binding transcriptional MocR family regulator